MNERLQSGDRFRDMQDREGIVIERCMGHEIKVRYDDGHEEITFEGYFQKIPPVLATGGVT